MDLTDVEFEKKDGDYLVCRDVRETNSRNIEHPAGHGRPELPAGLELNPFVDPRLREQLHYNKGIIDGEHRIITNLFIGVSSLRKNLENNRELSFHAIEKYFESLNRIITDNGGSLARIDTGPSSEKILIFFGAPKCFGNDAQNCLRAVIEMESALKKLNRDFHFPVTHKYGINSGLCFVGDVGGIKRKEYTAMVDAINRVAHVMGMKTIAEHIESEETFKALQRIGVDYGQGFGIEPPVPFKWTSIQMTKAS